MLTIKHKTSFFEVRRRLGLLPRRSFASVVQQGAAPQFPQKATESTVGGPVVPLPAPLVVAVTAAP